MRPDSFHADLLQSWSEWVLDNGLPELPGPGLAIGESVPVAYWVGPSSGAVLHLGCSVVADDEAPVIERWVDLYCRVDGRWEPGHLSGGGRWEHGPPLTRIDVPPDLVQVEGRSGGWGSGYGSTELHGTVGSAAAFIEVHQAGQVTMRPVEAPVGAFVVCGNYAHPFTVRVLDAHGDLLGQLEVAAGFADELPAPSLRARLRLGFLSRGRPGEPRRYR